MAFSDIWNKDIVTLDFETHYAKKYTLTSLTYVEYIHHELFYIQGFSYSLNFAPPVWVPPEDVESVLRSFDWPNTALLCHNTHFDASILKWKFGISPGFYLDTMLMARPIIYGSSSLDNITKALFPGDKNKHKGKELVQFKDIRELDAQQEKVMRNYCKRDVYITNECFKMLLNFLPDQEIELIDMTLRMAYDYNLQVNVDVLHALICREEHRKKQYIETYGADTLRSNDKFAQLLEDNNVQVPMKLSPRTDKMTYAFSKQDEAFMALLDHPVAAGLVEARLAVKSNILESRSERFINCQETLGYLPIFLNYAGARNTNRWSGGQKMNQQNLSRPAKNDNISLRHSLLPPPGHKLVVCDLSQIENRVLAWCAGDQKALDRFRNGIDPYKAFASSNYGIAVEDVTPAQRQIAKAAVLGLGYGMGAPKFQLFAKMQFGIELTDEEARTTVSRFRTINHEISGFWALCQELLISMANDPEFSFTKRGIDFRYKAVVKPNGTILNYEGLHYRIDKDDPKKNGFVYGSNEDSWKYIYGGLFTENIVQSLSRDIIADMAIRIKHKYGLMPAHTVHDELIYVCPEDEAEGAYELIQAEMCIPPEWCSDIPLGAEGGVSDNYGDAK